MISISIPKSAMLLINVHSISACDFVSGASCRKLFNCLELLGHRSDTFAFHVLHLTNFSTYTFVQVKFALVVIYVRKV